jgi:hypothetical protein
VVELPVTEAVKVPVAPVDRVVVKGEIPTLTTAVVTVMVALADWAGLAELVAVTVYVPGVAGAVYVIEVPVPVMVPPVVLQVTAVFDAPVTLAVKLSVAPVAKLAVVGVSPTVTTGCDTVIVVLAFFVASAELVAVNVYVPAAVGAV